MKSFHILALATTAAAHSAVSTIKIDGTEYPAREARYDALFGAKRVEWKYADVNGFPWMAVTDVLDPAITCGLKPQPPELKAVARAGANVTVEWSGMIKMHQGPILSYLGAWSPEMKAQDIKFFKIDHKGYDKQRRKWANEDLLDAGTKDTFRLPSDIKPGLYVLRTELLALHGNSMSSAPTAYSGPQFYTHCYNIEISGDGTVVPQGVTFPGGYKRDDPGVKFSLRSKPDDYIIPGPPVYQGKYGNPVGQQPVVAPKDTGAFPPEFEKKYTDYKKKDTETYRIIYDFFNDLIGVNGKRGPTPDMNKFVSVTVPAYMKLEQEKAELKKEAIALGYVNA